MVCNRFSVPLLDKCVCFLEGKARYDPKAARAQRIQLGSLTSRCLHLPLKAIVSTVAAGNSGRLAQWLARLVYTE
jgi:hypothetical protein